MSPLLRTTIILAVLGGSIFLASAVFALCQYFLLFLPSLESPPDASCSTVPTKYVEAAATACAWPPCAVEDCSGSCSTCASCTDCSSYNWDSYVKYEDIGKCCSENAALSCWQDNPCDCNACAVIGAYENGNCKEGDTSVLYGCFDNANNSNNPQCLVRKCPSHYVSSTTAINHISSPNTICRRSITGNACEQSKSSNIGWCDASDSSQYLQLGKCQTKNASGEHDWCRIDDGSANCSDCFAMFDPSLNPYRNKDEVPDCGVFFP